LPEFLKKIVSAAKNLEKAVSHDLDRHHSPQMQDENNESQSLPEF
tara:strand:- start:17 stop:151 length:135 start_codon:yes stop_codon:yes gene_type:complete